MSTVNMLEAKSNLSKLVEAIELGTESEIIIARNGRPVAKLVSIGNLSATRRIGVAKGQFVVPKNIDADNEAVAQQFFDEQP
jgi:prevent-host-death family protein